MSTGRGAKVDAGLHAVARVRSVREQDSRLGLQRALADERQAAEAVRRLQALLADLDDRPDGDVGEFVAVRTVYLGVGEALAEVRRDERAAHLVAIDAAARWRSDHARLGAVEGLLERRAEARAEEHRRSEDRELDDVAGRLWLRQSTEHRSSEQPVVAR